MAIKLLDKLKQALVDEGVITIEQLSVAETTAQRENENLSRIIVKSGVVTEEQLLSFIGDKIDIPYVNLKNYTIDRNAVELIPEKIARQNKFIPLFKIENILTIAMSNPMDIISIDDISKEAGCLVEAVIASEQSISVAIDQWYGVGSSKKELIKELAAEFKEIGRGKEDHDTEPARQEIELRLKKEASGVYVIKLVNSYIAQAILEGASDVHLQPKKGFTEVRFRINRVLYDRGRLPKEQISSMTSRIKIMFGMDISKQGIPQDGRISLIIRDRHIDIRASTLPSVYGENIALKISDKMRGIPALSELGLSDEDLNSFKKLSKAAKGMIVATGPAGSGRSTTIYSVIDALDKAEKNIFTIEDPIEYEIEAIVQTSVDLKAGVTFANGLRAILRQDPDVIYVGEIRDLETAELAVRAALTGHLVFSTLHTDDAVGAITRLHEMGIETGLIGSALKCSFAQRLVRKVCARCKKEYQPEESLLRELGLSLDTKFYKGEGCDFCNGIGYRGITGIFEVLILNEDISGLMAKKVSEDKIMEAARAQGMKTLLEDGLQKAAKGITTLDEVEVVSKPFFSFV